MNKEVVIKSGITSNITHSSYDNIVLEKTERRENCIEKSLPFEGKISWKLSYNLSTFYLP